MNEWAERAGTHQGIQVWAYIKSITIPVLVLCSISLNYPSISLNYPSISLNYPIKGLSS